MDTMNRLSSSLQDRRHKRKGDAEIQKQFRQSAIALTQLLKTAQASVQQCMSVVFNVYREAHAKQGFRVPIPIKHYVFVTLGPSRPAYTAYEFGYADALQDMLEVVLQTGLDGNHSGISSLLDWIEVRLLSSHLNYFVLMNDRRHGKKL